MRYEKEGRSMKYVFSWRDGSMEFDTIEDMVAWISAQPEGFANPCYEVVSNG